MEKKQYASGQSSLSALITATLWASSFPAIKYLLDHFSAESIMLFRFSVASATLLLIALIKKISLPAVKDLPLFFLGGFIGIFLYARLFMNGADFVPSGVSSFLVASAPVFTTLLSVLILKEKVKLASWVGILLSLCGLAFITASQMIGFSMNIGVVLILGASVSTSFYIIVQRKLMNKYTPLEMTAYCVFSGTLFMFFFFPTLLSEFPAAPISARIIPIYLGIFPAAIAYLAWANALSKAKSTAQVTSFLYLIPFISTLIAFFWLGERLSFFDFIGGIIVILGMIIANRGGKT